MHVLLISNFAPDRQESMLRFTQQLTVGLNAQSHTVSTWAPEPRMVRLLPRYRYQGGAKFIGYFDKFVLFPRELRRRLARGPRPDVVHIIDHANAVYAPLFEGVRLLGTCHDVLQIRAAHGEFPQQRVSPLGRRYQAWILQSIARLPHIVTPSAQTATELQRLAPLPPERMTVIPMGLNFPYRRSGPAAARLLIHRLLGERRLPPYLLEKSERGFLLNVGGGQWYKNRRGLLEIYAELRRWLAPAPRLVIVGKPLAPDLVSRTHALGLQNDVVVVSNVTALELQALYSSAEALLFPSWHEGFGWPVAEAQACGCPVFTSDRAPMTEVGGDAAVYLDPGDPARAAQQIVAAWHQRRELSARGARRAREWDPARMIDRYVETYARLGAPLPHAVA
jgi:glycosyltransferase involved in cell wall biosynthesis